MVTTTGLLFGLAFLLSPQRGLVAIARRRIQQKWNFSQTMLAIHLLNHEGKPEAEDECRVDHLWEHLRWQPTFAEDVIRYAERKGVIRRRRGILYLTQEGRTLAQQALVN